ncbi:dolichyl-phosphate-mannose--protein mannosyltransferase [Cellulomonas timonensis]|uniref:dolichyl-phosphate-mannose--protein mannosyltransferase n=1 Tax=Cellulomonas timonensis TaxID=1689271 RepID=UPI0009EDEED2
MTRVPRTPEDDAPRQDGSAPLGPAGVPTAVEVDAAHPSAIDEPPGHDAGPPPWPPTDDCPRDEPPADEEPPLPTVERLRRRLLGERTLLLDATPRARLTGWLWALAVTALAAVLRFVRLGTPHSLVFDETYYVKDAFSLLTQGYEAQWGEEPNPSFEAGDTSMLGVDPSYVVHPPVGKWLIGWGIELGGGAGSSAAWRLAAAIVGTLSVLLMVRIARRLFASNALGVTAGLLLAVDGAAIVGSRISLLDGFVMFFALAAFGALILDREQARRRLADRTAVILDAGGTLGWGPRLGVRWWRLAAAVLLGLCIGTKWSGLYFLAVFGLMSVAWDATARRAAGVRNWPLATFVRDAVPAGIGMVGIAAVTYVASWASWFRTPQAYLRQWAVENPEQGVQWLPDALRSLWKYHQDMWGFHRGLTSEHTYSAHPLGWIVQWRPTSYWYPSEVSSLSGDAAREACGADACAQAITSLGNPLLWWAGAAAIIVALVWLVWQRDWRAGAVLSGIAAGWLPWFVYAERTIFTFYSVAFVPWVVLTLVYVLGLVVGPPDGDRRARRQAIGWAAAFVALIVAVSAFFYPIWTAWVIPYDFWHMHMWLTSWI